MKGKMESLSGTLQQALERGTDAAGLLLLCLKWEQPPDGPACLGSEAEGAWDLSVSLEQWYPPWVAYL